MRLCIALAFVVGGCSSSKQDPPKPPPTPADAAKPTVATADDVAKLLPAKPGLPLAVAALRFDATRAQAKAAAPTLADDGQVTLKGAAGVQLKVAFHGKVDQVRYVALALPTDAVPGIIAKWGQPERAKLGRRRTAAYWFGGGVQAVLESTEDPARLTLWPYTPWKAQLGGDADRFGWESTSLLGLDRSAALAATTAYAPKFRGKTGIQLSLPRHEYREDPTWAQLELTEGKVSAIHMRLDYRPLPTLKVAYMDAVRAKWGQPVKTDGKVSWFGDGRLSVEDEAHLYRYTVTIRAVAPPTDEKPPK